MDPAILDYDLPADRIAQEPATRRDASRLLIVDRSQDALHEGCFSEIARYLRGGDLLVLNDTRVIPSRIRGRKESGGGVELTFLDQLSNGTGPWALIRSSSRTRLGQRLELPGSVELEVAELAEGGPVRFEVRRGDLRACLDTHGEMPLPPYIRRSPDDPGTARRQLVDRDRYQTVLARSEGAIAAPTAGLHFTRELLAQLGSAGVSSLSITLHVGYGSFQPVRCERLEDHHLRPERYEVSEAAAERINATRAQGGRVIAVGTTVVRTLETVADEGGTVRAASGATDLMVLPGHAFRAVDALLTNFHFPRTTLFALALAFGGVERVHRAYRHAVDAGFRFLSYGDAMLIV